jgi:hypothetical protein
MAHETTTSERFFRLAREARRDGREADAAFYRRAAINAKVRDGSPVHDHDPGLPMPARYQGGTPSIKVERPRTYHSDALGTVTIPEREYDSAEVEGDINESEFYNPGR